MAHTMQREALGQLTCGSPLRALSTRPGRYLSGRLYKCASASQEPQKTQSGRQGTVLQSVIALEQLRDSTWLCGSGCVPPGCLHALALADRNDIIEARLDRWPDAWRKDYREAIA